MTVTATTAQSGPFTPNGATTAFPFTFDAGSSGEVEVFRLSSLGVETTLGGYTVALNTDKTGTVNFGSAPAAGDPIYIRSNPLFTQQVAFTNQGSYSPTSVNGALDEAAIRDIWLRANLARASKVPANEVAPPAMPLAVRAGNYAAFDNSGIPIPGISIATMTALQASVSSNTLAIAQEISDRAAAVAAELAGRIAADNLLQTNINAEAILRANADNAEAATRSAADIAEATARVTGDATVLAAIQAAGGSLTNVSINAATRTILAALNHALGVPAILTEAGYEGVFSPNSSNLSAQVTKDINQVNYVPYSSDATGASGAWVRVRINPARLSKAFSETLPLGDIALPTTFNNQLGVQPYWDGTAVRFKINPYDKIDWTKQAGGTITFTGQPSNGDTVSVNGKTYTFQTALTNVDGNVKIAASTAATVTNLINAINLVGNGTAGTDFAVLMTANPTAAAKQGAGTTITLSLRPSGTYFTLAASGANLAVSSDTNVYFINYARGTNSGAGNTSAAPWKTWTYALANMVSPAIMVVLDDYVGANSNSNQATTIFSGKLKIIGAGPSGRSLFCAMNESHRAVADWAWTPSGSGTCYVSTFASGTIRGQFAQFDRRFPDRNGIPRALIAAPDIATCQATPGTFIYDSGTTSLYVNMYDGRMPDQNDGWVYAYGSTARLDIQQGLSTSAGVILVENMDACFNGGTGNGQGAFYYRPQTTGAPNTTRFGMRNCHGYGSSGNGLQIYDASIACVDNCHVRYNGEDGLNYHSFVGTGTKGNYITVYETDCSAFDCGYVSGFAGQAAQTTSCNITTCHDSINILRANTVGGNCNGGCVADVNGVLSVNLNVRVAHPNVAGSAFPNACFWHDNYLKAGIYSGMYLWGCAASDDGDSTINLLDTTQQSGGSGNKGQIFVKYWRGQTNGFVNGAPTDWAGVAL